MPLCTLAPRAIEINTSRYRASPLFRFLQSYYVPKGAPYNFTSYKLCTGSFLVPDDKLDDFYDAYVQTVQSGVSPFLTERPGAAGPFLVDIDFKFATGTTERRFDNDLVKAVAAMCFGVLKEYVKVDAANNLCYVFERPGPYVSNDGKHKDGWHMVFPDIRCTTPLKNYVRERVLEMAKQTDVFKDVGATNSLNDIVDKMAITNGWFVYGSGKAEAPTYRLSMVLDDALREVPIDDSWDLVRVLTNSGDVETVEYLKPVGTGGLFKRTKRTAAQAKVALAAIVDADGNANADADANADIDVLPTDSARLQGLLACLAPERLEKYEEWMRVATALKTDSLSNYGLFVEWSAKSAKFDPEAIQREWDGFKVGAVSMGTLVWMAGEDNPEECRRVQEKDVRSMLMDSLHICASSTRSAALARVFHAMHPDEYRFPSSKLSGHYLNDGIWKWEEDIAKFRLRVARELKHAYGKLGTSLQYKLKDAADDAEKKRLQKQLDVAQRLSLDFDRTEEIDKTVKELKMLYQESKFVEKLDCNFHLLGFDNGVLDLRMKAFRPARFDDLVSLSTEKTWPLSREYVPQVERFLEQVFPEPDVREYIIQQCAQWLCGNVEPHLYHFFTSPLGANGKSSLVKLIRGAFGQYGVNIPVDQLVGKRADSNSGNPMVLHCKGKRFGYSEEPSGNERLSVGVFKDWSSGGVQRVRALYSNVMVDVELQLHMAMCCNTLPTISGDDGGCRRRCRVVNFASQFVELLQNVDHQHNRYLQSSEVEVGIAGFWPEAFLAMLVDRYKPDWKYTCPESIREASTEYLDGNSEFHKFKQACIQPGNSTGKNSEKDFFTVKEAKARWADVMAALELPHVAENALCTGLSSALKCAVQKEHRVNPKEKARRAFVGWKLVDPPHDD